MIRALLTITIAGLTACACPPSPPASDSDGGPDAVLDEIREIAREVSGGYFGRWMLVVPKDAQAREIRARFPRVSVMSTESPDPPRER